MSASVMAGGMVGVGIALASALANSGPSADQLILEGLGKLSEQIEQFRKEMHERFDNIDRNLGIIFDEMTTGFRTLSDLARINREDVQAVRNALSQTLSRLDQIEDKMEAYFKLLVDQSFYKDMANCLHHKHFTGSDLTPAEYDRCVAAIFVRRGRKK